MKFQDRVIAIAVPFLWGLNFTISKIALAHFPPLFYGFLRFAILFPLLFIVPKPQLAWRRIAVIGLTTGAGPFLCINLSLKLGLSGGMAALLMQSSTIFIIFFSFLLYSERPGFPQILGVGLGLVGLAIATGDAAMYSSLAGLGLAVLGAVCWGLGNSLLKRVPSSEGVALIVWSSIFSALPLCVITLIFEQEALVDSVISLTWQEGAFVLYTGWIALLTGGSLWYRLLQQYKSSEVAPYNLLVSLFSSFLCYLLLGEILSHKTLAGGAIVLLSLGISSLPAAMLSRLSESLIRALIKKTRIKNSAKLRTSNYLERPLP